MAPMTFESPPDFSMPGMDTMDTLSKERSLSFDDDDDIDVKNMSSEEKKLRKMEKEKTKRANINTQFDKLCQVLAMGQASRVEKIAVLNETIKTVTQLKEENDGLRAQKQRMLEELERRRRTHPSKPSQTPTQPESDLPDVPEQNTFAAPTNMEPVTLPQSDGFVTFDASFDTTFDTSGVDNAASIANNGFANNGFANNGFANNGFANNGFANNGFANNGFANGYANNGYANNGYANNGYANNGYANNGHGNQAQSKPYGFHNDGFATPAAQFPLMTFPKEFKPDLMQKPMFNHKFMQMEEDTEMNSFFATDEPDDLEFAFGPSASKSSGQGLLDQKLEPGFAHMLEDISKIPDDLDVDMFLENNDTSEMLAF
jgi:hypothetical protein